jgi:hypothetical protein
VAAAAPGRPIMAVAVRTSLALLALLPVVALAPSGDSTRLPSGLTCVGRTVTPHTRRTVFVWEDLRRRDGSILFFAADNLTVLANLTKRDVDSGQDQATVDGSNATCCGLGFSLAQLSAAGDDLLGKALLGNRADDPEEQAVAAALPPFTPAINQVASFVGSRRGPAYPLTRALTPQQSVGFDHPWGWPGGPLAGPQVGAQTFGASRLVCANPATAGVVGGYLPVLRVTYDETSDDCGAGPMACCPGADVAVWDVTVLGEPDPPSAAHQTVWWRYLRYNLSTAEVLDTVIVQNNQAYPSTEYDSTALRAGFYSELLKTASSYDALFGSQSPAAAEAAEFVLDLGVAAPDTAATSVTDGTPMIVTASDPRAQRLIDQAKHSIIREWSAFCPPPVLSIGLFLNCFDSQGFLFLVIRIVRSDVVWGKYGVPPDQYGGTESDGFQENVNSGAIAAIAWGFFGTARGILSTYRLIVRTTCWDPDLTENSLRVLRPGSPYLPVPEQILEIHCAG